MLIDCHSIIKRIIHDLLLLRLLDLVDALDCLEISEMIDSGFPNLAVNFGLVLAEGMSETSLIEEVPSPTKDKFKYRPLERFIRVTVLIVFLAECGGREEIISSSTSSPNILTPVS